MLTYTMNDVLIRSKRLGVVAGDDGPVRAVGEHGRDSTAFLAALDAHGVTEEVATWRFVPLSTGYVIAQAVAAEHDAEEPKVHVVKGVGLCAEEVYALTVYQGEGRWWSLTADKLPPIHTWGTAADAQDAYQHANSDPNVPLYALEMVTDPHSVVELTKRFNASAALPQHVKEGYTLA